MLLLGFSFILYGMYVKYILQPEANKMIFALFTLKIQYLLRLLSIAAYYYSSVHKQTICYREKTQI